MFVKTVMDGELTYGASTGPPSVPGAAGGIDMDSDLIIEIAKEGSNICGVKLT